MRNFLALAPMLWSLASANVLALDDTPTVAPHFQIKGEDSRQAARPAANAANAAATAARRSPAEPGPAKPDSPAPASRPHPLSSRLTGEQPGFKLR